MVERAGGLPKDSGATPQRVRGLYRGMLIPATSWIARGIAAYRCGMGIRCRWCDHHRHYGTRSNCSMLMLYQANSRDRAWACGSLLPNDLGLFDMLAMSLNGYKKQKS